MNKLEFARLFEEAVERATQNAEQKVGVTLPRSYQIQLYAPGVPGNLLSPRCTLDKLYLNENQFYRIIDTAVVRANPQVTTLFMRVSGHPPSPFAQTWNKPLGMGPFKQIISDHIELGPEKG